MKQKPSSKRRRNITKSNLRLPNLGHAQAAVLNSLNSTDAKRGYRHAIDEFVDWYCSEPRLAFNRIVVLRYRSHASAQADLPQARIVNLNVDPEQVVVLHLRPGYVSRCGCWRR
jgi:hypothetical protein